MFIPSFSLWSRPLTKPLGRDTVMIGEAGRFSYSEEPLASRDSGTSQVKSLQGKGGCKKINGTALTVSPKATSRSLYKL